MSFTKNKWQTIITIYISMVIAVFFMWIVLRGIDFNRVKYSLERVNYFWILISVFLGILAYIFRAVRWNLLLEPMGYRISNNNAFWTIAFGYIMNLTVPRSGEVARATALYRVEKIPVEKSFVTIVIERVVDLCFMLFFLFLAFVFNGEVLKLFFDRLTNYRSDEQKSYSMVDEFLLGLGIESLDSVYLWLKIGGGLIGILFFLVGIIKFKVRIISIIKGFLEGLLSVIKGIIEGLLSVFKIKSRLQFLGYSVGIWLCYFFSAYVLCFSLKGTEIFGVRDVFLIITAGTLGMMVPTSGGAGSFHIAVKLAIAGIYMSFGKEQDLGNEVGFTYALISHTSQMCSMLFLGLVSIPFLVKNRKD